MPSPVPSPLCSDAQSYHTPLRLLKDCGRRILYNGGLLSSVHRARNRRTLTAVMFHRVVPVSPPPADLEWTIPVTVFADCLTFFSHHYNIVSLSDLDNAERVPLPDRALLITFDDGSIDTFEHAAPVLKARGLPAVLFVTADAISTGLLWQNELCKRWTQHKIPARDLTTAWALLSPNEPVPHPGWDHLDAIFSLSAALAETDPASRQRCLTLLGITHPTVAMLSAQQLLALTACGVEVACHGLSHTPMPFLQNPQAELLRSHAAISAMLGSRYTVPALSFPHGRYNDSLVDLATRLGYRFLFSSKPVINQVTPDRRLFGRIHISYPQIVDPAGKAAPDKLATWLFSRPVQ
jgi:peptidoglycan/xylan/chitin deacetylase (PgdA/CDA1 family)